jgi:hypothetical protein
MQADWNQEEVNYFGGDQSALQEAYKAQPVGMTMIREGTQFPMCCNKCAGCIICTDCCADNFTLVAGDVPSPDTKQIGQHLIDEVPNDRVIGSGKVPSPCGGMCTPTLNVSSTTVGPEPWAKVEGPTCFGGCSEFCFDFEFPISKMDSEKKAGDLAMITKLKPTSLAGAATEALTDSDTFKIDFKDAELTAEQKATFLATLLLTDYSYFEGVADKCHVNDDGSTTINCCSWYICGCMCPVQFTIPRQGGGDPIPAF